MRYYKKGGEVYREDDGYSENRPRGARQITETEARSFEREVAARNEADFEARQEQLERDRARAAAEADQKREVLSAWLAEAGAPPEVLDAL